MEISTGIALNSTALAEATDNVADNDGALLSGDSTNIVSRRFSVRGTPVRIIAYGLFQGKVYIQRILPPITATINDACGNIVGASDVREKAYMIGCKQVCLCVGQDEIVIDAVGDYKLVYAGNGRQALHVVHQDEPLSVITNNLRGIEECCDGDDII